MAVKQKLIIGIAPAVTIEVEGDTPQEIIEQAAFWNELPDKCPECDAPVFLTHREPRGFNYYGLRCIGTPAHETTFGEYKAPRVGLYYKREWGKAYGDHHEEAEADETEEHKQLNIDIVKAWASQSRNLSYAEAVLKKFNKRPGELSIDEKRQILGSLQGAAV